MTAGEAAPPGGRVRDNLRARAARGTIVNGLFIIGLTTLSLVRGIVAARLIAPEEFGLWGLLILMLNSIIWVRNVGIGERYVQQSETDQRREFQIAFTLELLFMGAAFAVMLALLPVFAFAYDDPRLVLPGAVLGLVLVTSALSFPVWTFHRQLDFRRQRLVQAVEPVVGFAVTVGLALAGAGYWSLVAGMAAGSAATAAVALKVSPHPIAWRPATDRLRSYFTFSWPLLVGSAVGVAMGHATYLIGKSELGLRGLGAITLAGTIALFTDKVDQILNDTLYPILCAVPDRLDLLREGFEKANRIGLMWGAPFAAGVALFAGDLVRFVLGREWDHAVVVLQGLAIAAGIRHVGVNWHAVYRGRGETRPIGMISLAGLVAFAVIVVPPFVAYGLKGLAWGMVAWDACMLLLRARYVRRLFPGFPMLRHVLRALAPVAPVVALLLLVRESGIERTGALALAELVAYAGLVVLLTFLFERALIREMLGYVRRPGPAAGR